MGQMLTVCWPKIDVFRRILAFFLRSKKIDDENATPYIFHDSSIPKTSSRISRLKKEKNQENRNRKFKSNSVTETKRRRTVSKESNYKIQ